MAKRIIDLVTEKGDRMARAREDETALAEAERNAALAARAIMEGRFSLAWRQYMLQFVEKDPADETKLVNPRQLERLLAADDTIADDAMNRRRAYLLGNAVCGGGSPGDGPPPAPGTPQHFDFTVNTIDNGL